MISRVYYYPGDWIAKHTAARGRRALAAWVMILSLCPGVPIWYILREQLWYVGLLSVIALTLAMWGVTAAETPVEGE